MNFSAYLSLTKPRISLLFAFTGLTALIMEGSLKASSVHFWILGFAIFVVGGSANAFNQYFERDVDSKMQRTAKKRSLPLGKMKPSDALLFSIVTAVLGNTMLFVWGNWISLLLGVGTILFYSFYYTLWLKPRTPYNIVIGGAAGATGPLIAWAAVTGHLAIAPLIMFLIVFIWTPPHFWALALCCKEDYARVSYPMLPNVKGDAVTRRQILFYSILLLPTVLSLYWTHSLGLIYFWGALVLTILFVAGAYGVYKNHLTRTSWQFFGYSILYLLLLFTLMICDKVLP